MGGRVNDGGIHDGAFLHQELLLPQMPLHQPILYLLFIPHSITSQDNPMKSAFP